MKRYIKSSFNYKPRVLCYGIQDKNSFGKYEFKKVYPVSIFEDAYKLAREELDIYSDSAVTSYVTLDFDDPLLDDYRDRLNELISWGYDVSTYDSFNSKARY